MPMKPPLTHFLAIPLYNSRSAAPLTSALAQFNRETERPSRSSDSALRSSEEDAKTGPRAILPPGSIRPPTTLHLTLGVMSLTKPERLEGAVGLLMGLDVQDHFPAIVDGMATVSSGAGENESAISAPTKKASAPAPIQVQLRGLHSMQDARATSVLYAAPEDGTDRLFAFCDSLREGFASWDYIVDEGRALKLHATIVNTIYAKSQGRSDRGKGKVKIDARELVEQWKDFVWADVTLDKVVIYEMGAKEDENGEITYKQVAEKALQ